MKFRSALSDAAIRKTRAESKDIGRGLYLLVTSKGPRHRERGRSGDASSLVLWPDGPNFDWAAVAQLFASAVVGGVRHRSSP